MVTDIDLRGDCNFCNSISNLKLHVIRNVKSLMYKSQQSLLRWIFIYYRYKNYTGPTLMIYYFF